MTFENLTCEQLCDLICGEPEKDDLSVFNEQPEDLPTNDIKTENRGVLKRQRGGL